MDNENWIAGFFILVMMMFLVGLGFLLKWDATNDARDRQAQCAKIAQVAGVEEFEEKDYNCYMVKDGKLETIDL